MAGPWDLYGGAQPTVAGPWAAYQNAQALEEPHVNAPGGIMNALRAGYQSSATGLILRGELPDVQLEANAPWYERAAYGFTGVAADLPEAVAGVFGGGAAGGVVGSAVPVVGTAVGAVVGGGAGAMAVPQALREGLMQAYRQGGVHSWSDVWNIIQEGGVSGAKGAVVGGLTAGAGRYVGGVFKSANPVARGVGVGAAETATLATAGAALEGHLPRAEDFLDAAIVVGGLKTSVHVAGRLRNIYARTGIKPADVALDALKDPKIKEQIIKEEGVPDAYKEVEVAENAKAAVPEPTPQDRARAEKLSTEELPKPEQQPGEPARPTEVNYNYINAPEEIGPALARLSKLYKEDIQTQRRGTVTHQETIAQAEERLADVLGTRRVPGQAVDPAELHARVQLAEAAAEELMSKRAKLSEFYNRGEEPPAALINDFLAHVERSGMILSEMLGARSEAGRALNILKASRETAQAVEELNKVIDAYGGRESVRDLVDGLGAAKDRTSVLKAARKVAQVGLKEKIIEVWKSFILSGPTTHQANLLGNSIAVVMRFPERLGAALLGKLHKGDKVYFSETPAMLTGMIRGTIQGTKLAGEVLKGTRELSGKVDMHQEALKGKVGEVIRFPFRALSAEDALFRTFNEQGEISALAARHAIQEGLRPGSKAYNERVVSITQNVGEFESIVRKVQDEGLNPKSKTGQARVEELAGQNEAIKDIPLDLAQKMLDAGLAAGDRAVFTDRLGQQGTHLQLAVRGTPFEFILPFIRTPINLLKWAARYTPGVNFIMKTVREDLSGANGKIAQDMAMSRMILGAGIATIVWQGVNEGTITGGGLAEPEKFRSRWEAGWRPYSLKIGDTYYSYQRIDPLARVLAAVADTTEIYNAMGEHPDVNMFGVAVSAVGNATVSQTYLSGVANAINAVTDAQRYGSRWIDQYAASFVPSVVSQFATAKDPHLREVNSIMDAIQSRVPGWREELLPKIDPLTGKPKPATERLWPTSPITTATLSDDPVIREAMRLSIQLPPAPRTVHVGRGTGKAGNVQITPEQRNAFTVEQGEFAHQLLSTVISSPGWSLLSDRVQTNIYNKVMRSARKRAALVALPPEARMVEAQRISNEIIQDSVSKTQ